LHGVWRVDEVRGAATEEERAGACGTRVPAEELLPEDAGWGGE